MFVSQLSTWWLGTSDTTRTTPTTSGGAQGVPFGQLQAARENAGKIYLVGPKYALEAFGGLPHLLESSYQKINEQMGHAMAVVLQGGYWTGVQPRTISISGATITARYWVQSEPLVIDTSLVSNRGVGKGFEYWDDSGAPPAITGVAVSGDTVTITLAGVPTGNNKRLRYAYTEEGLPTAGLGARGNLRDSDPAVGDLSGAHLYNWAVHSDDAIPFNGPSYAGRGPVNNRNPSVGGKGTVRGRGKIQ